MKEDKYIIVAFFKGVPYFLQMRGVVNWFFYNNVTKVYKTLKGATTAANKVKAKYACEQVKVYKVTDAYEASVDNVHKWEKHERERIVFVAE
jgi:hypothetical protein